MQDLTCCDITPWYNEICTRMHEAHAAGTSVVQLGASHPRGFIPTVILRRPAIRALLKEWQVDTLRPPPDIYPAGNQWLPAMNLDLSTCDLAPFINEIELRNYEAEVEAYNKALQTGQKEIPITDLTNHHPRGGIPHTILIRLDRRKSKKWLDETRAEVARLKGEANKAEAFAKTQEERAQAFIDQGRDGTNLLHGATQLKTDAAYMRAQAKLLEQELVGA